MIGGIRDVDISARIHSDSAWEVELGRGRQDAVTVIAAAREEVSRDRTDGPHGVNLADYAVPYIGEVQVPRPVQGHPPGLADISRGRGTAVAGIAEHAGSGYCGD